MAQRSWQGGAPTSPYAHVMSGHQFAGHSTAEAACRFGNTELHAAFALLHLAVHGWFLSSAPNASWRLRGLISGGTIFGVAVHALLGGVCYSTAIWQFALSSRPHRTAKFVWSRSLASASLLLLLGRTAWRQRTRDEGQSSPACVCWDS